MSQSPAPNVLIIQSDGSRCYHPRGCPLRQGVRLARDPQGRETSATVFHAYLVKENNRLDTCLLSVERVWTCPSLCRFCAYHLALNGAMGAQASYSLELISFSPARRWETGLGACRPGAHWPQARETQPCRPSIDRLRGFCAHSRFHCTPHYHTSPVYDRSQIYFHAFDLMITALSLCCGMKDGNGWVCTRTESAWAQSSQRP